jgi:hypothetical protein
MVLLDETRVGSGGSADSVPLNLPLWSLTLPPVAHQECVAIDIVASSREGNVLSLMTKLESSDPCSSLITALPLVTTLDWRLILRMGRLQSLSGEQLSSLRSLKGFA